MTGTQPPTSISTRVEQIAKLAQKLRGVSLRTLASRNFSTPCDPSCCGMVSQRVSDGVLLRLIGKWLKAGVMEEGQIYRPDTGTPQGGVISPLLANIYLHEVLDVWFERDVKPRMRGRAELIRYADDFVMVFETQEDAQRVAEVLPKRFEKYGLRLHPEKTRLLSFQRPEPPESGNGRSFDLLGFTHFWGKSRKGKLVVRRKTAKSRFSRTLQRISEWCRANRHLPLPEQHRILSMKLRGHDALLRPDGKRARVSAVAFPRREDLAQMAASALMEDEMDLGALRATARGLALAACASRPLCLPRSVNLYAEEPDAGNPHVRRVCGSPGRAIPPGHPDSVRRVELPGPTAAAVRRANGGCTFERLLRFTCESS